MKDVLSPSIIEAIRKQGVTGKIHINSFSDNDIITVTTMHSKYYLEIKVLIIVT
jgi:ribosomal protein S11